VTLDFSNEVDVLNYAFALEQLEAAFYTQVVAAPAFASTFPAANERRILTDLRDHEIVHREFFAAALGSARIPNLTPNFSSVNFGDRLSVLNTRGRSRTWAWAPTTAPAASSRPPAS
jgi:hypothetical protein